jgi:hypothetical protein
VRATRLCNCSGIECDRLPLLDSALQLQRH